jgi:hypothetical protein
MKPGCSAADEIHASDIYLYKTVASQKWSNDACGGGESPSPSSPSSSSSNSIQYKFRTLPYQALDEQIFFQEYVLRELEPSRILASLHPEYVLFPTSIAGSMQFLD